MLCLQCTNNKIKLLERKEKKRIGLGGARCLFFSYRLHERAKFHCAKNSHEKFDSEGKKKATEQKKQARKG